MNYKHIITALLPAVFIHTTSAECLIPTPSPPLNTTIHAFSPTSASNIAVYFGQTNLTSSTSLLAQCADPSITLVILAFVTSATSFGTEYPTVNFGAACDEQSPQMVAQAPGLLQCTQLESHIKACQGQYGKKVLLSLGGATGGIVFGSVQEATAFGDVLWNLFGPTGRVDPGLRPFGTAVIDGFDIDNETNNPQYYDTLSTVLRSHFSSSPSKKYYLTSAPQCLYPDASTPLTLLKNSDFVFVQFYNNPYCQIGSSGFLTSVKQWSSALSGNGNVGTRLFIGAPAFAAAGVGAYAAMGGPQGMQGVAASVRALGLRNLGGVMFWDGPEGRANTAGGKSIIEWASQGLAGAGGKSGVGVGRELEVEMVVELGILAQAQAVAAGAHGNMEVEPESEPEPELAQALNPQLESAVWLR